MEKSIKSKSGGDCKGGESKTDSNASTSLSTRITDSKIKDSNASAELSTRIAEVRNGDFIPTAKQEQLLEYLLNNGFPSSWTNLAKKIKINNNTITKWRKDKEFMKWLTGILNETFKEEIAFVKQIVFQQALKGKIEFIRIFLIMCGELNYQKQIQGEQSQDEITFKATIKSGTNISVKQQ